MVGILIIKDIEKIGKKMAVNYDFTTSNFILMIGGQILFIVIGLMIIFFGAPPIHFNKESVKEMILFTKQATEDAKAAK